MNHIAYRPFLSPDAGGASAAEIPKEKKQIDQKTFSYISNYGFALLSLVAALFFSIPFFGAEGILLGVFAALQLVALLITFLNARKEKSAINLLPTLFGADLAGYMILRAGSVHALTEFLNWLVRGGIGLPRNLVVIAAGIIVVIGLFVSIKNSDIVFSMLLSLGALAALIYGCTQERTAGMRTVLALTDLCRPVCAKKREHQFPREAGSELSQEHQLLFLPRSPERSSVSVPGPGQTGERQP